MRKRRTRNGDVVRVAIVGAGPSGLFTAYFLEHECEGDFDITLFESDNRVGGKIVSRHFRSAPCLYEAGVAELYDYSCTGPDYLRNLVDRLGLATVKMHGRTVVLDGCILRDSMDIRRHLGVDTLRTIEAFREKAKKHVTPRQYYHDDWQRTAKDPWSRRSLQWLLDKVADPVARKYLKVAVHSDIATEPHLTTALTGLKNCLMDVDGYMELYSIVGGIERLPEALRQKLSASIELGHQVTHIEKTRDQAYRVSYRNGVNSGSQYFDVVVVAVPNYWLPAIQWGDDRLKNLIQERCAFYDDPAHFLRVSILFKEPFWRKYIPGSYFQLDAFGGCCVYDESARHDSSPYGILGWLLAGNDALTMSNYPDEILVQKMLASLPGRLQAGKELFMEGRVHRWLGSVNANPGGNPVRDPELQHWPDREEYPGLFLVGDYMLDSTVNSAVESAGIATELIARNRSKFTRSAATSLPTSAPQPSAAGVNGLDSIDSEYYDYYDGASSYASSFRKYFDETYVMERIQLVWGMLPPYRILDAGSANGMTIEAFARVGIDAWGIESNHYIHSQTVNGAGSRNILGDIRALPFEDNSFDFVYDTCLCYVPEEDIEQAIREYYRVARHGVYFGSVTRDVPTRLADSEDLFYGTQTLLTYAEWSEKFQRYGFRQAITDPGTLRKVWNCEKKTLSRKMRSTKGTEWYRSARHMKFCFYSKQPVTSVVANNGYATAAVQDSVNGTAHSSREPIIASEEL